MEFFSVTRRLCKVLSTESEWGVIEMPLWMPTEHHPRCALFSELGYNCKMNPGGQSMAA